MLPALISQGLLKCTDIYDYPRRFYYSLESIILTLAFMALARIKNPEQLKQCRPGEIGKIIGLDRIPEVKCLRGKIKFLSDQSKARELNRQLIDDWYKTAEDQSSYLYIDGHQRIYYGNKANLPLKYISRQRLCLAATTEYWVNDGAGLPVLMVMGELTEKLEEAIDTLIIPELQKTCLLPPQQDCKKNQPCKYGNDIPPVCTLIFDREGYHPSFFKKLWDDYHIAVITYRKNVPDKWDESSFKDTVVTVLGQNATTHICEQEVVLDGFTMREIRRLGEDGHQTSVITTNRFISKEVAAGKMFGRWVQENFFRYLIADYDFDKMISFGTEEVNQDREVVNPQWRKADYRLKKQREKSGRLKAKMYVLDEKLVEAPVEKVPQITRAQAKLQEKIAAAQKKETELLKVRSELPARIKIEQMVESKRYNKLKHESKILMNIVKMICYRAETLVANLIAEILSIKDSHQEKRMIVKQIISSAADIIPDEKNNTLTVVLHALSARRFNDAAEKLAHLLNQTETVFPGTEMRLIFKTTALPNCDR